MKKGVIFLLLALALIVLVSPGLIGRLAERSLDEGIRTGTIETEDVIVKAEVFDRGWFTTEGQHRIEFREGQVADQYRDLLGLPADSELPVILISTRVDHGLIPVASMGREDGSLMPGLGDAVSTVEIELPDGERVGVPGAINTRIALTGTLISEYELAEGALDDVGEGIRWGAGEVRVTTEPDDGTVAVDGALDRLELLGGAEPVVLSGLSVDALQLPSPYDFPLGEVRVSVESILASGPGAGPFEIESRLAMDNGDLRLDFALDLTSQALPFGEVGTVLELNATGLDPERLSALVRKYQALSGLVTDPDMLSSMIEPEAQALAASGLSLEIPRFNMNLPDGTFESSMTLDVAPVETDRFTWSSLLLASEGRADVRIPDALLQTLITLNPEVGTMVGMGFLRKDGDDYISEIRFAKGILTINGAPMPIPLTAP